LLISVRLIPFNLLHYHNSQFASYKMFGGVSHWATTETISHDNTPCYLDQFLTLTATAFVLEVSDTQIDSTNCDIGKTPIIVLRPALLHFDILNKGSPQLV
jgi:hypothetical protein